MLHAAITGPEDFTWKSHPLHMVIIVFSVRCEPRECFSVTRDGPSRYFQFSNWELEIRSGTSIAFQFGVFLGKPHKQLPLVVWSKMC